MINFKRSLRTIAGVTMFASSMLGIAATASAEGTAATTNTAATATADTTSAAAPSGAAMPVGNLPGWKQIFTDDFTTDVPLGSFPAAVSSKWTAYPSPWKDTSGNGTYSPSTVVSVANGIMNSDIHTDNGTAMVSAMSPKLPTSMLYGRYTVRYRFDSMPGYKMAWMLWPDSNDNKTNGEVDFPEMNLDTNTAWAYDHRINSTGTGDQSWANTPLTPGGWHTATIEWSPDLVVYLFDGQEIGRNWERTPNTPMHWILQTETSITAGAAPDPSVRGNVQVDWVAAYSYDPSTSTDQSAPAVTNLTPANSAALSGSTNVAANATDDVGVVGVQFKVDGKNLGTEVAAAPYTTPWNTTLLANGAHTVTATARDQAGKLTTATSNVTINNVAQAAPTVVSSVPQTNGTLFPVAAVIKATFDQPVTGVSNSSVVVTNTLTGAVVPATVTYTLTANSSTASVKPTSPLADATRYTVSITSAVKAGGVSIAPYSWSFATGPAPTASATTPAVSATNVSRSTAVVATADKDLARVGLTTVLLTSSTGTKVSATVTFDAASNRVTLTPKTALAAKTKYTVSLTNGIKDIAGNALKPLTWSFTTAA